MNGYCKMSDTYEFTKGYHLRDFPRLPSYAKLNKRINNLADAIIMLAENLTKHPEITELNPIDLVDSCPIVLASSKRHTRAKVAPELCSSGYCASKGVYYYGVKLLLSAGDAQVHCLCLGMLALHLPALPILRHLPRCLLIKVIGFSTATGLISASLFPTTWQILVLQ